MSLLLPILGVVFGLILLAFFAFQYWFYLINKND
jgi:hypothetical protein